MKLEEAIKLSEVEHALDGKCNAFRAKAVRKTKQGKMIFAFTLRHLRIKTYFGPSTRWHLLKRIGKRTNVFYQEVKGKEDWIPYNNK